MTGKIKGTGSYIPVQVWDNDKLSHMMDTSDEWIRGRTGIGQRHIASVEETVSYMAAKAGTFSAGIDSFIICLQGVFLTNNSYW